jgi:hypothetical protein
MKLPPSRVAFLNGGVGGKSLDIGAFIRIQYWLNLI